MRLFFFSSRRRHTRYWRDWSSDVCSSDLAAVQSYWRIPELKLGFDLGAQPWDFMGTPNWFISHSHLDHIAALPVYVARRRMMKMEPPNIYRSEERRVGKEGRFRWSPDH